MKQAHALIQGPWRELEPTPEPKAKPYRFPWRAVLIYLAVFIVAPGLISAGIWIGVWIGKGMDAAEYRAGARDYRAAIEALVENVILSREQRKQMHTGGRSALEILRAKR